jgi:hypothetical protein
LLSENAADRELAHRAASPHRNGFASFEGEKVGSHIAGRKNIGEEQHLFVAEALRHLDRADIGVGHAKIFRLPAGIAAEQMRIAERSGRRIAPELGGIGMVGIGAFAP